MIFNGNNIWVGLINGVSTTLNAVYKTSTDENTLSKYNARTLTSMNNSKLEELK